MFHRHPPRGFTLVELLIVAALIGLLVALLLPAIQAATEAARRSQCQSNLGQLIVAVHNYEMAHGVYPPGSLESQGPILNWPKGYHHSWLVQLLPYIEHHSTQKQVDFVAGVYDASNVPVRSMTLDLLHCPSDTLLRGRSNYAGVHHDRESAIDRDNSGVFFLNSRVRQADVTDGVSQTMFLGEKMLDSSDLGWMSGTRATLRNTAWATGTPAAPAAVPPTFELNEHGLPELSPQMESTLLQYRGPNAVQYSIDGSDGSDGSDVAAGRLDSSGNLKANSRINPALLHVGGFSGAHPGGSQYAFGDGSVQFLSNTIDPPTYQRLGNRHDGRLLDPGKYR
jgi:prepilin-type N-terminal cleavage/methylation domain-containing protein/prepilin-type processing-associated H-X9-DG protein